MATAPAITTRIQRADAVELRGNRAAQGDRPGKACRQSEHHENRRFIQDQPENRRRVAAERHADPDLARPLADVIGEHAVHPDRREQQRHGAEPSDRSIGARRGLSDRSIRFDIAKTSVSGSSGSISASARSTEARVDATSVPPRIAQATLREGVCA